MVATKYMQSMAEYNVLLTRKVLLFPDAFKIGDDVVAKNLATAVELNGVRGTIREVLAGGQCFTIDFGPPHGEVIVKPANMIAAEGRGAVPAGT